MLGRDGVGRSVVMELFLRVPDGSRCYDGRGGCATDERGPWERVAGWVLPPAPIPHLPGGVQPAVVARRAPLDSPEERPRARSRGPPRDPGEGWGRLSAEVGGRLGARTGDVGPLDNPCPLT